MSKAIELLKKASELYNAGANQAEIRKKISPAASAIKCYWICFFDERYPDLDFLPKCLDGTIKLNEVRFDVLQGFGQRVSRAGLVEYNQKLAKQDRQTVGLLRFDEFDRYISELLPIYPLDKIVQCWGSLSEEKKAAIMKIVE